MDRMNDIKLFYIAGEEMVNMKYVTSIVMSDESLEKGMEIKKLDLLLFFY